METKNNLKNLGVFKDFSDGTLKTVFDAGNNEIIEIALLMNKEDMDVVCAPTHHFCNLGCKMCHLTNKGLNKKMLPISIDNFIEALIKSLSKPLDGNIVRRTSKEKLLISFMGVGEPLLNLKLIEEIYKREDYIKNILGYKDIGFALATMMPNNNISKLTETVNKLNIPLKFHFSMHTPITSERFNLIPSTNVSVEDALSYLIHYRNTIQKNSVITEKYTKFHRTTDPIEIHYTLIENVNDSDKELNELSSLLDKYKIPIKFIKFNPINDLKRSTKEATWIQKINTEVPGLRTKTYAPPGKEIGSSCGEFTKHYYHQEIETEAQLKDFEDWKRKHQIVEKNRSDYLSWDEYFMAIAKLSAMRSKDPSTQVGACIVGKNNRILSIGYNGAPNGFEDEAFPWDRNGNALDTKYPYVCHGEMNAILNYSGNRRDFENAKIYVDLFPCNECAKLIIQSGINEVIYLSDKYAETDNVIAAKRLFDICGIKYNQLAKEKQKVLTLSIKEK
jgi:dCMP deaminase